MCIVLQMQKQTSLPKAIVTVTLQREIEIDPRYFEGAKTFEQMLSEEVDYLQHDPKMMLVYQDTKIQVNGEFVE